MTSITQFPGVDIHRQAILQALRLETGFWYLATPYSKYVGGLEAAHVAACQMAGNLMKLGIPIFCPIAHSHSISKHGGVPALDHEVWLPADKPMMDAAYGLIVGKLNGWQTSFGISEEIRCFQSAKKLVHYICPESLHESA